MIGVFDSGFGGLSVFRELARELPEHDFVYFGDNARAPYGDRSPTAIYGFTREACEWLFREGCQLIILACNTASAVALRRLQQEYLPTSHPERRILGVLVPVAETVGRHAKAKDTIGVIATRATVESGAYARELAKFLPAGTEILQQACPLLAPLVEEGWLDHPLTRQVIAEYLAPLREQGVSALVLGCTHYEFLAGAIRETVGERCFIPETGAIVASSLRDYLARHPEIERTLTKRGIRRYVTTDDPARFAHLAGVLGAEFAREPERYVAAI